MSYQTYTTEAIVCGSYDRLTADRTYLLFTQTAGMVFATARSAREERSKQRYALQDFARVRVSLVKGKAGWRIGSVESLTNYYLSASDRKTRGTVVGAVQFLRRLVTGEEVNERVFNDVMLLLEHTAHISATSLDNVFDVFRLRTLAHLGYVAKHPSYQHYIEPDETWLRIDTTLPPAAQRAIEQGLSVSQL